MAPTHWWRTLTLAAGAYLLLSAVVWWNVWSSHPTSTATCGCGDSAGAIWVMEWPMYALSHGLNPLFSTAMGYPSGFNLLANAGVPAIGIPLAPLTWLFGPIASLNVALTLAPTLSAMAMFVLLRRWVSWIPAAFLGGLFYGFSPFVLTSLANGWVNLGTLAVPPLIVLCLDRLLFEQRHRPGVTGFLLGLLVALQFFLSTEILLITAIMGAVAIVCVAAFATVHDPQALRSHARFAAIGLGTAAVTAIVLLAYPAWFALAGPSHFSDNVWPNGGLFGMLKSSGTVLKRYILPTPAPGGFFGSVVPHVVGGYQGPMLSFQYFGIGTLVVLIGGFCADRRNRRLWLFGAIALISVGLSLRASTGSLMPSKFLAELPLFKNIVPYRFVVITYLAVAVMLGIIVEHTYVSVHRHVESARVRRPGGSDRRMRLRLPRWAAVSAGLAVAAMALVPPASYLAQTVPITTRRVVLPTWFRTVAPGLRGRQVLLVFPALFGAADTPTAWQAVDRMRYSTVQQVGPANLLVRIGEKERKGAAVIADASAPFGISETITPADVTAVWQALHEWGVTMVVIPDEPGLPAYERIPSVTVATALVTAATGQPPVHQAGAWVWANVDRSGPPMLASAQQFTECTFGLGAHGSAAVGHASRCLTHAMALDRNRR